MVLVLIISSLNAQENLERVICTTGGTFLAEGNKVKLYSFETGEQETNVIAEFLGDFSNDVIVDGRYAYAHVGRGFDSPAGLDAIYKVDLITYEVVDSLTDIPGAAHLFIYEDLLMVGKGFGGQGDNVEFFNKNDLSEAALFQGSEVLNGLGGHTLMDDKLYLSYTASDTGRVAVYNMETGVPSFENTFTLDTLSKGIGDLLNDGTSIYALNNFTAFDEQFNLVYAFSGVTKLDVATGDYNTVATDYADNALVIAPNPLGTVLIADFGMDGNLMNANTLTPLGIGFLPFYTAGVADAVNEFLWVQVTDFSSFGKVSAYNNIGEVIIEFDTDKSGSAIDLVYNDSPTAVNDAYEQAEPFATHNVLENDIDPEGEELTLIGLTNFAGGDVIITDQNEVLTAFAEGSLEITFSYIAVDIWGRETVGDVIVTRLTNTDDLLQDARLSVYPNPTHAEVFVDLQGFDRESIELSLTSLDGRRLFTQKVNGLDNYTLDISALKAGIYILEAQNSSRKGQTRLVKF